MTLQASLALRIAISQTPRVLKLSHLGIYEFGAKVNENDAFAFPRGAVVANMTDTSDRVTTRIWEVDLSSAGSVYVRKVRPANRKRQKIARFLGIEGTVERFSVVQTMPYCGYEEPCPPTQPQYTAVSDFYMEGCETRYQAKTLLCARDYAEAVAQPLRFTGYRKAFLSFCIAEFILSDKDLRSRVRAWCIKSDFGGVASGITTHKPYKKIARFAEKLIDDMRGCGSQIFG